MSRRLAEFADQSEAIYPIESDLYGRSHSQQLVGRGPELTVTYDPISNVKQQLMTNLPPEDVDYILGLRYNDGDLLFDPDDPGLLLDLIILVNDLGDEAIKILEQASHSEEKLPWSLPQLGHVKGQAELEYVQSMTEQRGIKTDRPCKKCGTKEVIYVSRQMRSADEPESIYATCVGCKNTWRVQ